MKLACLFSGGKDSTYAIHLVKKQGHEVTCLLSVFPKSDESHLLHFPNILETKIQSKSMDIPQIIEYLADLSDTLGNYGIHVDTYPGLEYRTNQNDRTRLENKAGYLKNMAFGDLTFSTHLGVDDDSLSIEIYGSKEWLENLVNDEVKSFAYPYHDHDGRTMSFVRDSGHIAARSGLPSYQPWSAYMFGGHTNSDWLSGLVISLYEKPITFFCVELQELDVSEMESWLYQQEHLPNWKGYNSTSISLQF